MHLFEGILRFSRTGAGDVNTLHGDLAGLPAAPRRLSRSIHAGKSHNKAKKEDFRDYWTTSSF